MIAEKIVSNIKKRKTSSSLLNGLPKKYFLENFRPFRQIEFLSVPLPIAVKVKN